MSRLLTLYPAAWRNRYADEVADLLAARPPSLRDRLDLIRGAIDAWLHPQVFSPAAAPEEEPVVRPIGFGVVSVLGGLMWAIGGVVQHTGGLDPMTGYKENAGTTIVLAAGLVTGFAAIAGGWSGMPRSRELRRAAVAMLVFACVALAPWPIVVIGFWGQLIATMAFGVLLDRIGRRSGMLLIVGAVVAITFNTESSFALATVPLGFAWLAVGAEAVLRRQVAAGVASS